jgi:DNA-directed RNA polymerase delta subunit
MEGKCPRNTPYSHYQAKYYEEYWGQKKKTEEEVPLPVYSFIEEAKLVKPQEDAKVEALHSIEDILADFGEEVVEDLFEEPLEMLDDDFDDYSEEDAPKKKRKYKRRHSDEEKPKAKRSSEKKKRKKSSDGANSFRRCAHTILKREGRPLSAAEIVKIGIKEGMISTTGKTPQNTLASVLYCEMKKDPRCAFVKVAPMTFGLRSWNLGDHVPEAAETKTRNSSKRRRKKQVEEEEEEEESAESEVSEEDSEEIVTEQPIIINLSAVPAEK